MKKTGASFFILILLLLSVSCKHNIETPLLWNMDRLDYIKKNRYKIKEAREFLDDADRLMLEKDIAVTQKTSSINRDKHNYESLSSYFWPNPIDSTAPYIHRRMTEVG